MKPSASLIVLGAIIEHLRSDSAVWGQRVYTDHAPAASTNTDLWVVARVVTTAQGPVYNDGVQITTVEVGVQAVSSDQFDCGQAARDILIALQDRGSNDSGATISLRPMEDINTADWQILSITAGREIRLDPGQDTALRFYERGYQFTIELQDSNAEE